MDSETRDHNTTQYSGNYSPYLQPGAEYMIPTMPEDRGKTKPANKSPSPPHAGDTTGTTSSPNSESSLPNEGNDSRLSSAQEFSPDCFSYSPQGYGFIGSSYDPLLHAQMPPYHLRVADTDDVSQRYDPSKFPSAIKLLVSNNVAGSIIGRGGSTISELQTESGARIKLSQTGDFYPGTQDRVCLIQGEIDNVKTALRLLLDRLYILQEHQHTQHIAWQLQKQQSVTPLPFDFVVRLLVPSSACGMIIGKSGSNVKHMEEQTGVMSIRLSPKDMFEGGGGQYPSAALISGTGERAITISGPSFESCLKCLLMVFDGMIAHPEVSKYTNMTTSYDRLVPDPSATPPVDLFTPGRPAPGTMVPVSPLVAQHTSQLDVSGIGWDVPYRRVNSSPDLSFREPSPADRLFYSPSTPQALYHHIALPVPPMDNVAQAHHVLPLHPSFSAPDLLAAQLEHAHVTQAPNHGAESSDATPQLVSQTPVMLHPGCFEAQIQVPDAMIGSILGRQGRTLNELQMLSSTRIRISQRGEYAPGTKNRVVTIRGPSGQNVMQAQFMMSQKLVLPNTAVSEN